MEQNETSTHSFIIKIWLEETLEESGRATWRGHITHVPGGERRYLKQLDDIIAFIAPFLYKIGIKPGLRWRLVHYLSQFFPGHRQR
jgi:hypothetical protein